MNIEKLKEIVKAIDVEKLKVEELYYYFLLVRELERNRIVSFGFAANILDKEDYE